MSAPSGKFRMAPLCGEANAGYASLMKLGQIGVRRAEIADAGRIADVHDAAWRQAYRGIIPGKDLERMIARRGPLWWKRALDRHTAVLVLEVGGRVVGAALGGQPETDRRPTSDHPVNTGPAICHPWVC